MDQYQFNSLAKRLKKIDFLFLKNLYYFRCLTIHQSWDLCYRLVGIDIKTFIRKRIVPFSKLELLSIEHNGKDYALQIKNKGIEILQYTGSLNNDFFDIETKKLRTGILKEGAIRLQPKFMNHQIHLNQFVIDFNKLYRKQKEYFVENYTYFDEKFMSKYTFIRPDGMISLNKLDLFLEMDMGTESKKQLIDKWTNYRMAINSSQIKTEDAKIIVLFILDCPKAKLQTRKNIIRYTIDQTLIDDYIDRFDIYIGTKDELLETLFQKILPIYFNSYFFDNSVMNQLIARKHGFVAGDGGKLKKVFFNASYAYYIRMINEKNRIRIIDKKIQEYLFDEYLYSPMAVLNKIVYHDKHSTLFHLYYKRHIGYIVLVESEQDMFNDLRVINQVNPAGVYFTTIKRLASRDFYDALYQYDEHGDIYHFTDYSLTDKVKEKL